MCMCRHPGIGHFRSKIIVKEHTQYGQWKFSYITRTPSQINVRAWTSQIRTPMVHIDRILLIQVDLEELIMPIAPVIFVSNC